MYYAKAGANSLPAQRNKKKSIKAQTEKFPLGYQYFLHLTNHGVIQETWG